MPLQAKQQKKTKRKLNEERENEKQKKKNCVAKQQQNNITLNYSKIINNKNIYVKVVIYLWLKYPSYASKTLHRMAECCVFSGEIE